MKKISFRFIVFALCIILATCDTFGSPDSTAHLSNLVLGRDPENMDNENNMEKRAERYAFGLGRRAYTYTSGGSGVKRLPVYNFGLGKRGRPYSFVLGKRSESNDDYADFEGYDNLGSMAYAEKYDSLKRGRPYSFGLGKRDLMDADVERRSTAQRYNFGLGRR